MPRGKGKISRTKKEVDSDSDSDNDYESADNNDNRNTKNNAYDATANGEGQLDEEDILMDGDMGEEEDWDDEDMDDQSDNASADDGEDGEDDDCVYEASGRKRGKGKINGDIERDDDDEDDNIDDDLNINENDLNPDIYVLPENRRSRNNLTKYEKVRLLGERTTQLARGAKPMIKNVHGMDPKIIAQLELEAKMIPIMIIRPLTNGKKEIWKLSELNLKREFIKHNYTGGVVDREKIDKRTKEFQKGGNIAGFTNLFQSKTSLYTDKMEKSKSKTKAKSKTRSKTKTGSKSRTSSKSKKSKVTATKKVKATKAASNSKTKLKKVTKN